jgi:hypothetical protein
MQTIFRNKIRLPQTTDHSQQIQSLMTWVEST